MFATILAGTDGSEVATVAVRSAVNVALALSSRLLIVSAYEPISELRLREQPLEVQQEPAHISAGPLQWMINPHDEVLAMLLEAADDARAQGVADVETFARQGDAADAILDVAEEQGCDLIVVGNRGMTGAKRFLLGSVPNKVSHYAPCSVLIVRTG